MKLIAHDDAAPLGVNVGRGGSRLERLYAANAPRALRLAYLITGDIHLAEDVVHDAFIKVAGRFRHLIAVENFHAYLNRTVINLARDHFRRLRLERSHLDRERARAKNETYETPSVEDQSMLMEALQTLSSRQRAAIVLKYYEDLSEQQIADVLSCSPGAVKSLLLRGKEGLRDAMEVIER